jgi:hypothetical protein
MTIGKLKEQIKDIPDDMEIILQKNAEGNGYETIAGVHTECFYVKGSSGWDAQLYDPNWSADDAGFDDEVEWEEFKIEHESGKVALIFP